MLVMNHNPVQKSPMSEPTKQFKKRVLLAATAGSVVLSFVNCGRPTGNLMAEVFCKEDGGPPNCRYLPPNPGEQDAGLNVSDGGTIGGDK